MHAFRVAMESGDIEGVVELLAENVTFRSPVVFQPYSGLSDVTAIMYAAARVFQDFHYERAIGSPDSADHALVFSARIGERHIHGCDFVHTDEHGKIDELTVMVRPLSAALAVSETMKEQFLTAKRELVGEAAAPTSTSAEQQQA
ncbi:nuclear transport factor 2 family protein [Nocardia beijingensis]|uniref:nuclear transport factor 2 family protein n=1 Tax=Nocardia beijingensis TaxID=95162 RepID=UPI0034015ADD